MAYPIEYRRAVAAAYDACGSSIEVAAQFRCSASWVRQLILRRTRTGSLAPQTRKPPNAFKLQAQDMARLAELIAQTPDMTLGELAAALEHKVSVPTVHRATLRLKLPLKKKASTPPSRTGRT